MLSEMIREELQNEMFVGDPKSWKYGEQKPLPYREPSSQPSESIRSTCDSLESVLKNAGSQTALKLFLKLRNDLESKGMLR